VQAQIDREIACSKDRPKTGWNPRLPIKKGKKIRKPGSVLGNHISQRPTRRNEKRTASFSPASGENSFLYGLAPDRVCRPLLSPKARWALTPPFHVSPRHFPPMKVETAERYVLCGTFRRPEKGRPSLTNGILSCGARTFLPAARAPQGDCPIFFPDLV